MKINGLYVVSFALPILFASCQTTNPLIDSAPHELTKQAPKTTPEDNSLLSAADKNLPKENKTAEPQQLSNNLLWEKYDFLPSLLAFEKSCKNFSKKKDSLFMRPTNKKFGTFGDWKLKCKKLKKINKNSEDAKSFFEKEFKFISSNESNNSGTLTGYYEPIIEVRRTKSNVFSEPILTLPLKKEHKNLTRSKVKKIYSDVIAFGKPIDVFFMQIQGSGKIELENGEVKRAVYSGNNGKPYISIGKILIENGELLPTKASKLSIEKWMQQAGYEKTKELMNKNPRYIFFKEEEVVDQEGPLGAMRVPLTDMVSMASDPRYNSYGSLVWLETNIPKEINDFKGEKSGLLVSIQDTGSAIKGPFRGDLYFGSGKEVGLKAGVMKHDAEWKFLVPRK